MSFKSLVKKLMKEGKSKEAATKIAGKVASEKMKGAGSGPTSKQKARMKKSPSKMKSPAKKPLVGKQKNLPEHLKKAILDAPAKMLSKSGMKMMKEGSPATLKLSKAKKAVRKGKMTPDDAGAKGLGYGKDYDKLVKSRAYKKQRADEKGYKSVRKAKKAAKANDGFLPDSPAKMKTPMKKSKKKVEQDYARNAIADYKAGKKKEAKYEKKKALELAAGESGVMMKKSPSMMKTNQDGGAYAAKNPAAPARQLKKLGSILSKHMKSK